MDHARQIDLGCKLLVGYALAAAAALAAVGAITEGPHTFARTAGFLVLAGCALQAAVSVAHRRARRALLSQRPDLADSLARRPRPGSGWAALVYLPLLLACVSIGSVADAVAHPPSGVITQIMVTLLFLVISWKFEAWYDINIRAPYLARLQAAAEKTRAERPA